MRILFSIFMWFLVNITVAAVPLDGWYDNIFIGYSSLLNNLNVVSNNNVFSNIAYNSGYNAGARFGYKSNPMRYEGEFTYIHADATDFKLNYQPQTGVAGFAQTANMMANVYYDFPGVTQALEPFLGVGLGFSWVDVEITSTGPSNGTHIGHPDTVFAYQATTGIAYNFAETASVDLAYRYFATTEVGNLGKIFQANLVTIGATYRFDDCRYK